MNVMLLSAGLGSRLMPYTADVPKPAIPFLTAPLAGFAVSLVERIKIDKFVVNTHHLPMKIENLYHWMKLPTKNVAFTHEPTLLGSGGGIHNARRHLDGEESFLVINADEVILPHKWGVIEDLIAFHRWHKGLATLLTMLHPGVGSQFGGAWTPPESTQVQCFSKTAVPGMTGHHFIGVMILDPRIFKYFKVAIEDENILYETLTKAMGLGEQVHVFSTECEWFETGNPKDFLVAAERCLDALEKTPDVYWVNYLAQTLRVHGEGKVLIEKQQPALMERIRSVFKKNMIRFDG